MCFECGAAIAILWRTTTISSAVEHMITESEIGCSPVLFTYSSVPLDAFKYLLLADLKWQASAVLDEQSSKTTVYYNNTEQLYRPVLIRINVDCLTNSSLALAFLHGITFQNVIEERKLIPSENGSSGVVCNCWRVIIIHRNYISVLDIAQSTLCACAATITYEKSIFRNKIIRGARIPKMCSPITVVIFFILVALDPNIDQSSCHASR